MARKRTSNKQNLNLWVDKDLVETLKKLELNSSVLFTEAAKEKLKELEKQKTENDSEEE